MVNVTHRKIKVFHNKMLFIEKKKFFSRRVHAVGILNNLQSLKFGDVLFGKYKIITQTYKLLIPSSKGYQLPLSSQWVAWWPHG